jgi:mRNA-degrading endonuclease toxin of MazEF toxin-antitoxin module
VDIDLSKAQKLLLWNTRKMYYHAGKYRQRSWTVKRGEVYFVDMGENIGSEENKTRPCVVIQSNSYNFNSPVFTCAIISNSAVTIPDIQVPITGTYNYLDERGTTQRLSGAIDLGQIKTVGKERIISKACVLTDEIAEMDRKLLNILGLTAMLKRKEHHISSLEGKIEYLTKK